MCGVFADFERSMIQERVKAGLARARREGKRLGRPPVPKRTSDRVLAIRATGKGIISISRELGIGVGTVRRIARACCCLDRINRPTADPFQVA
jgi:DNA invertase Pin-like site-specific DNA recombinase